MQTSQEVWDALDQDHRRNVLNNVFLTGTFDVDLCVTLTFDALPEHIKQPLMYLSWKWS